MTATVPRRPPRRYDYETDGQVIYRESFATIRREAEALYAAGLPRLPADLATVAVRVAHAAGDVEVLRDIAAHPDVVGAARSALRSGAPILTDSQMLAHGVTRRRLPSDNEVVCTLRDPRVADLARSWSTTRSAAAVSLWGDRLAGAVVAFGNAPTALFHLLELLMDDPTGPRPAAVIGMPVGFVGSAEAKVALAQHRFPDGSTIPWLVVHGRRGGSAMAAAALNAIATESELA
jgi:precorrin-8X/cobalt-precorrin-8 methylmutase